MAPGLMHTGGAFIAEIVGRIDRRHLHRVHSAARRRSAMQGLVSHAAVDTPIYCRRFTRVFYSGYCGSPRRCSLLFRTRRGWLQHGHPRSEPEKFSKSRFVRPKRRLRQHRPTLEKKSRNSHLGQNLNLSPPRRSLSFRSLDPGTAFRNVPIAPAPPFLEAQYNGTGPATYPHTPMLFRTV